MFQTISSVLRYGVGLCLSDLICAWPLHVTGRKPADERVIAIRKAAMQEMTSTMVDGTCEVGQDTGSLGAADMMNFSLPTECHGFWYYFIYHRSRAPPHT